MTLTNRYIYYEKNLDNTKTLWVKQTAVQELWNDAIMIVCGIIIGVIIVIGVIGQC